ncbi:hypothetical protein GCM10009547_18200 [Sporichthya brevicatena]|uniref:Uncharacterized protein n=1 Tax=Sporichthya brevicatena TaxID=171442 RepID=A0ABN1GQG8_9ACTN
MRGRRLAGVLLAGGLVVGVGTQLLPTAAAASASFDGSSSAYGLRVNESIPGAPGADTVLDGGGPTAQAAFTSLGGGTGYAALPDPGQFLVGVPGLVAGLGQINQELPEYPFAVQASTTDPEKELSADGYAIRARVGEDAATSSAAVGVGRDATALRGVLVKSDASVSRLEDGSVVSTATSIVEGLTLGPVTIGRITSTATRTLTAAGKLVSDSDLSVTNVSVAGTAVTPPTGTPGEGTSPFSLGPAVDPLLKPLGISFMTMAAQEVGDTVIAPALVITGSFPVDPANPSAGTGTYNLILGQSTARLLGQAAPAYAPGTAQTPSGGVTPGQLPSTDGLTPDLGVAPGALPGAVPGVVPGGVPAVPLVPVGAVGMSDADVAALLAGWEGAFDIGGLYVFLVVAGLSAFVVAQVVRLRGVRAPWTSSGG